jgi:hypothetical protein
MPSAYIDDGYSLTKTIPAVDGVHDEVVFSYRPITLADVSRYNHQLATLPESEHDAMIAGLLAGKIISWNLRASDNSPVPVSTAAMLMVLPVVFWAIFKACFRGTHSGDLEENAKNLPAG